MTADTFESWVIWWRWWDAHKSVRCTEIFLVLSGIQVDQLQNAIIHFMAEAGRAKPERGISLEISKEIQVYWGVLVPIGSGNCELYGLLSFPLSSFFLSFFLSFLLFFNTYSFCSLNSRYMHQVQKITLRRKREKRNTNTSGKYILTSKVVPLVTQFFCLFGNLAAKSELWGNN